MGESRVWGSQSEEQREADDGGGGDSVYVFAYVTGWQINEGGTVCICLGERERMSG